MGLLSDLIARISGKSRANDHDLSVSGARISKVLASASETKLTHDKLRDQLFEARAAAFPIGSYDKPAVRDPSGPLALHLSPEERLKIWLSKQTPEVVDSVACILNWDFAEDVILWLLSRHETDSATAVKLFMRSEPGYYALESAELEAGSFAHNVIKAFSANWTAGKYRRGGVGYDPKEPQPGSIEIKDKNGKVIDTSDFVSIKELADIEVAKRSSGLLPWPPLHGLQGPFPGPKPRELSDCFKNDKTSYYTVRFLLGGLGTWIMDSEIDENDYKQWLVEKGLVDAKDNLN